jgi:hypothetical protein
VCANEDLAAIIDAHAPPDMEVWLKGISRIDKVIEFVLQTVVP